MNPKKSRPSSPATKHFEKARDELEQLLKIYDLSQEEYDQLIEDIRRRQKKEKGREFDRLDEFLEE